MPYVNVMPGIARKGLEKDNTINTRATMLNILNPLLENFSKRKNTQAPIKDSKRLAMITGEIVSG
jgi:hypothetical protein